MVIPVMTQHYTMLQRNLLYTGVTRGKREPGSRRLNGWGKLSIRANAEAIG